MSTIPYPNPNSLSSSSFAKVELVVTGSTVTDGEVFLLHFMQATTSGAGEACGGGKRALDGTARNTRQKNEGNATDSRTRRLV